MNSDAHAHGDTASESRTPSATLTQEEHAILRIARAGLRANPPVVRFEPRAAEARLH